ncbi:MAG: D-aminoacyl-tRNA deacylase [Bacteroidales bacterium]
MRVVIQRVKRASVSSDGELLSCIGPGLLVLAGFEEADTQDDIEWMSNKIVNLRIFNDNAGVMNLSVKETLGEILVISQFTLHALTKKGSRPSYIRAAHPDMAIPLYEKFLERLTEFLGYKVGSGRFGAMMDVELVNDGPVTIIIDTKNRNF